MLGAVRAQHEQEMLGGRRANQRAAYGEGLEPRPHVFDLERERELPRREGPVQLDNVRVAPERVFAPRVVDRCLLPRCAGG